MNKTPNSESKGKKKQNYAPFYEKDPETGKIIPLPLPEDLWKRSIATKLSDKKSSEKKTRRKNVLQPLVFTEADFQEEAPIKKRKLDLGSASKIISKPKRTSGRFSSTSTLRRSLVQNNGRKTLSSNKCITTVQPNNSVIPQDKSPLMNLEDVEEELIKTNSVIKVPKKFNFAKVSPKTVSTTPTRMPVINEEPASPDTFTENELKCMNSPSVMSYLNIGNNINDFKGITEIIENVIKKEEEAFMNYAKVHQENMKELKLLLNFYNCKIGKENGKKFITTPTSKKDNLRKKVLKKNLQNELQQSPRTRSAFNLYNSLRSNNPVLETPKIERRNKEESPGKFLSDALMKQCLLLQTPVHK